MIKHDHAKEKLLSTLTAMEIEPTHLFLSEDNEFDDLFEDDDYDTILDDNAPDFVLTRTTTDDEINTAGYADMLFQMRLREKKVSQY